MIKGIYKCYWRAMGLQILALISFPLLITIHNLQVRNESSALK